MNGLFLHPAVFELPTKNLWNQTYSKNGVNIDSPADFGTKKSPNFSVRSIDS